MTFVLAKKRILLISPNEWGKMFISKHHYALELVRLQNEVYFLNPPDYQQKEYIKVEKVPSIRNLTIITYRPILPYFLRFHLRKIYDYLIRFEIRKLMKTLGEPFDIVWCFEGSLYGDLSYFKCKVSIFHSVDLIKHPYQIEIGSSADVILSVSPTILEKFDRIDKPKFWVNHGLSPEFVEMAKKLTRVSSPTNELKVGYIGNLMNSTIDKHTIIKVIEKHPQVQFHFVGPFELSQSNVGGSVDSHEFIHQLNKFQNVKLHGVMTKEELVKFMPSMDLFLLSYVHVEGQYDRSNAHKILEYLSTGKVLVANSIYVYRNHREIIQMLDENSEKDLLQLFDETISKLDYFNSSVLQAKRIEYALDNSYEKQVQRIARIIEKL